MKARLSFLMLACSIAVPVLLHGQTVTSQVRTVLQGSSQAMVGDRNIQDVTLTGTAQFTAGSEDDTGSFTFRGLAGGFSRIDLGLTSGERSETRQPGNGSPSGAWTIGDGVLHASAQHNLMSGYWWPSPALIVNDLLTNSWTVVTFLGEEGSLAHFSAYQQRAGASSGINATSKQLTQFDLWLDATTLLPAKLSFSIHPDQNAGFDIPVRIEFSNYQAVNGIVIPTHVQKFINNTLTLDAQIQSASINSGLTASVFTLQ